MPTYDYQCRSCHRTIEVIHAMTADGPSACEACGGPMRRVLFPAGIIFKGSGFYRTDSRTDGSSSSGRAAATPSTKEGASTTTAPATGAAPTAGSSSSDSGSSRSGGSSPSGGGEGAA